MVFKKEIYKFAMRLCLCLFVSIHEKQEYVGWNGLLRRFAGEQLKFYCRGTKTSDCYGKAVRRIIRKTAVSLRTNGKRRSNRYGDRPCLHSSRRRHVVH